MGKIKSLNKDNKSLEFLTEYLNTPSPTGFEYTGQKVWLDFLKDYVDTTFVDTYGTAVGVINPDATYRVVIEAHADEISRFVNYIDEKWYIYVIRNGGSDHQIAPSMRVNIWTKNGPVTGIFWRPAIHVRRDGEDPKIQLHDLSIDVWANNKEEVEKMGIHVGTVVTFDAKFMTLNDRYYVCRALDNRIGGYMIAQVAKKLKEHKKKLPFWLYIVNSVQEEVGLYGAQMITDTIKPNVAIVTDVTHDTSTPLHMDKKKHGDTRCGLWPVVSYAPSVHHILRDLSIQAAEKNKIPFQRQASSRYTGTDTDAFAFSNGGVASTLISLPLKYMHTTVESVDKNDVEATIDLMYHTLLELDPREDYKYIKIKKS
jgi:putative aminopeptidase FrvX